MRFLIRLDARMLLFAGVAACGSKDESGSSAPDASQLSDGSVVRPDANSPPMDGAVVSNDASSDASPVSATCSDNTLLFCDDFESYSLGDAGSPMWTTHVASKNDTLTIDGTHARGTKALHVHVSENEFSQIIVSPFTPPNNSLFGRAYV